ncbi:hypothetical protein KJ591_01655, partial [Patescibacteria group bacterium]|nr:hypothetical protein [Patescibacteria group bacterium]
MSPPIVEKISSPGPVFLIIPFIIVVLFMINFNRTNNGNDKIDCLTHSVTFGELTSLSTGTVVTQEDVDEINQKPLCRDICLEQIRYSKENPHWQANNGLRNICR